LSQTVEDVQSRSSLRGGSTARQKALLAAGVGAPILLYLLYVNRYSLNVPVADDWNVIRLASAAIHHKITLHELWVQYGDTRLFVGFLFFAAFAVVDHLNEKSIILFSAGIFIASFVLLLFLVRSYLRRRLTFFPTLLIGVIWFSLADVENSLWSFQLAWYFVIFGFMAMVFFLLVPRRFRNVFFVLAILAAIAASYAEVQGFVVWPVGLVCLLWTSPWTRRTYVESGIWVSAAILSTLFYLHGFIFSADTDICVVEGGNRAQCSLTYGLSHPVQLAKFFVVLVGNVVPTNPGTYVAAHEFLGAVICIVAIWTVVRSIRERAVQGNPLPVVLIAFALLFDVMLALSRLGEGLLGAGLNRYTMPNIVLLVGIVVYLWAHPPNLMTATRQSSTPERLKALGTVTLAVFFVVQTVVATQFGITNARAFKASSEAVARVVVNLDRVPPGERACYFQSVVVGPPVSVLEEARDTAIRDQLTVFRPGAKQEYRDEGPPRIARCDRPDA
jgi:hypothetical protein